MRKAYIAVIVFGFLIGTTLFVKAFNASVIESSFLTIGQSFVPRVPLHIEINTPLGVKPLECEVGDPTCVQIRNAIRDMIALDQRNVDRVLDRYHLRIKDFGGIALYPRP